jgi:hypothetical protein
MSLFRLKDSAWDRYWHTVFIVVFLLVAFSVARPNTLPEVSRLLPVDLGDFHQVQPPRQIFPGEETLGNNVAPLDAPSQLLTFAAVADYASSDGEKLNVFVSRFENDSAAYARFVGVRRYLRDRGASPSAQTDSVGTASFLESRELSFFKGATFVSIRTENGNNTDRATAFGRLLAATLDNGEGDIPVLVKHLPNWESAQNGVVYAVSAKALVDSVSSQPILKEVTFEGGTEAVVANYGQAQLVIVEFTTPQFSIDQDQRVTAKIQELKSQGQPVPTGYRRVGNYSVFVFNATDEKSANELIDQVQYQQVVQWLGDDPHMAERLQRYFQRTTGGVLIAVLKSSGLSLMLCLGVGALFGALLFRHRRAQQATLYSDAGGAVRLNLDDLTDPGQSRRLLTPGKQPESGTTPS